MDGIVVINSSNADMSSSLSRQERQHVVVCPIHLFLSLFRRRTFTANSISDVSVQAVQTLGAGCTRVLGVVE